jgi:short-subunit dehydrogenase
MNNLRGRVVVITGASSGFGRGAALKFAEAGANVVLAARRKGLLKDLADQCKRHGIEALALDVDVSDSGQVQKLASTATKRFGRIDVWVNDAGVATYGRFDEAPLAEHEQVIRTNLLGTLYGSYAAIREFRKRERGVLINISSFAGQVGAPYHSSYSASKFGMRGLDMALRAELRQNGEEDIHVCTVMPVSFDTPFFQHAANHSGKPVQPIPPVYDPQKVVDTIYDLTLNPRDEVTVGITGKLASVGRRIAPKLVEKQMARKTQKAVAQQEETVRDTSGSLFKPVTTGDDVYGGWREPQSSGSKIKTALLVGLPVAVGLTLMARRRQQNYDVRAA